MERSLGTHGNLSIREADFTRGAALITLALGAAGIEAQVSNDIKRATSEKVVFLVGLAG